MIYLATPYSHPDPEVMEQRFQQACKVAGKLMGQGHIVFSPIAHTHPIAVEGNLDRGWGFWGKFDYEFVSFSEEVWVVKMDGWDTSRGVAAEIKLATELGKPVKFLEAE